MLCVGVFWRTGFHLLLLEILPNWWLFPGLTRQGSVNSARAAEVVGSPAGQWTDHNTSGTQDSWGFLSFSLPWMSFLLSHYILSLSTLCSSLSSSSFSLLINWEWRLMKAVTPIPVRQGWRDEWQQMKYKDLPALLKLHTVAHRMNFQTIHAYISEHSCGPLLKACIFVCVCLCSHFCLGVCVCHSNSLCVKGHASVCVWAFLCIWVAVPFTASHSTQNTFRFQSPEFLKGNYITT